MEEVEWGKRRRRGERRMMNRRRRRMVTMRRRQRERLNAHSKLPLDVGFAEPRCARWRGADSTAGDGDSPVRQRWA